LQLERATTEPKRRLAPTSETPSKGRREKSKCRREEREELASKGKRETGSKRVEAVGASRASLLKLA
jgi:hypothetical protein